MGLIILFKNNIEKAQQKEITDYNTFIKDIFSSNKKNKIEEITEGDAKKEKNFDILKYLSKIIFNDYFTIIKKEENT